MKITDYKNADCPKFRVPAIDLSTLDEAIESTLTSAWEKNYSAKDAMNMLATDPKVKGVIAEKLAENLEFQRQAELQNLRYQRQQEAEKISARIRAQLKEINSTVGKDANLKKKELGKVSEQLTEGREQYSVAQKSLEEMRARVQEQLKYVGGEKGFEKLIQIDEILTEEPEEKPKQEKEKKESLESLLKVARKKEKPKRGFFSRAFYGFLGAFGYRKHEEENKEVGDK